MPPERGYVDRRHQRRGGLGADPGHREEALVDLVARQRVGHERVELLDVGVEGGYLPGEYPDRDVLAGREPPSRARRGQQRLPEPPGPRRGGARAPGGVREPAPAGGGAPRRRAELGERRHVPAARRVDGPLQRGVGLQQGRAQAVLRPGPRGGRELAPRRQDAQRGGALGLLGERPEGARDVARGAGDHLGVDGVGLGDAREHPARSPLGVSGQVGAGVPVRMGAREDQRADVSLLVDDDQRARAGAPEQPVDVAGPVLDVGPEDDGAALVEGARAVRPLPDIDPQVGHGGPASLGHGVSSPLSRPEPAEATPTLPGRGPSRARHISISRFPRALPPRWQHPPGPLRGRGRRPSGAVGRRPSVRPNRNTLKVKEPPLRTAQTVMGELMGL